MTIQSPIAGALIDALRDLEHEYCRAAGVASTTCWHRATGNMTFLVRMEKGRTVMVESVDKAVRWFSDNWPEGARWPKSINRPATGSYQPSAAVLRRERARHSA
jgi:hypothetical protein